MQYYRVDLMWGEPEHAKTKEVQKRLRKLPTKVSRSLVSRKALAMVSVEKLVEAIRSELNDE